MKTRLLSVLLVFLLIASVPIPAVSAEPSRVYYELQNHNAFQQRKKCAKERGKVI